ncbi:SMI1/KNR4 family protein [Oricola sp.]|uniref:SMI1/KNR4 family protein n=1 Tax=Oricola sp. TaxID=1979950 RepID=UPI0025DAE39B|nr:SMI1/KNR4 family protein [Oricola sp.]MCI5076418.1 SMI1/KNR4 family protein [Oricola sp.]
MKLGKLTARLPPPQRPLETEGNWEKVEENLGVTLPEDYKEYIGVYGSGAVGGFLTVFNPFADQPGLNLLKQMKRQLDVFRELRDKYGEPSPFAIFPERDGLLPVAMTDNGDVVFWLTVDLPENWSIVVNEARSEEYQHFECGLTELLAGMIDGSIRVGAFPESVFQNPSDFRVL